jgi:hypothetical protein
VGRRQRQRDRTAGGERPVGAPVREFRDEEGNVLALRGSLPAGARRQYAAILAGGLEREDAWQRAVEFLFERLAVSWTIAGLLITRQRDLVGRYRIASSAERRFVREALREHLADCFPELHAP